VAWGYCFEEELPGTSAGVWALTAAFSQSGVEAISGRAWRRVRLGLVGDVIWDLEAVFDRWREL